MDLVEILMPRLGLTMTEGTLITWFKKKGDTVKQGDILFEFESEKATMQSESPADGTMGELLAAEGQTIPCGTPIATIETTPASSISSTITATPAARRRAHELGIRLQGIQGRGVNGRVHVADVEDHHQKTLPVTPVAQRLAQDLGVDPKQIQGSGPGGRITRSDILAKSQSAPVTPTSEKTIFTSKNPLQGIRRVIGERMSTSIFTAPHVTLHTEVDATALVSARQQVNEALAGRAKISYNAFFISFAAHALREFPAINACLVENEICIYADANIALAVDTERGLLVPVIRRADQLTLLQIQQEGDRLIEQALAGKSQVDDLNGGTFTITNLGMYGIDAFTPIINQPQAAILGIGRIIPKPVGFKGQIALRDMITLSLSFDHRLVDGAPAAHFLQRIGHYIERPITLML